MRLILLLLVHATAFLMSSCRDQVTPASGKTTDETVVEKGSNPASDAEFVGLSEDAGASLAAGRGLKHRVVSVDGQLRPTTRDYRMDRVNFELEGGKIVKVSRG